MKKRISLSEEKLIEAIGIKSRIGAEALYDMYSSTLYWAILKIVKNREISEDVLQKSFIKIWYSFEKYNAKKGRLFTWMLCLTRNLAKDTLRSNQYRRYLATEPIEYYNEKIEQPEYVFSMADIQSIKLEMGNLNKSQRDILDLIYFKGCTHTEAADELNVPLGTVKTRLGAGLHILKGIYKEPSNTLLWH